MSMIGNRLPQNHMASPKQNHILAALSAPVYDRLLSNLELISMPLGMVLRESGSLMHYMYFPTSSIVSLLYVVEEGASVEIAVTGNEGLIGFPLFMGGESSTSSAVVQSAGYGYRLRADILKREFVQCSGELHQLAMRYMQALIAQMMQTAVCNRYHTVDQQLARRLLLSMDRLSGNELVMTQELLANMLGVRREGVTEAAGKLHQEGVIDYRRGHITILDRTKLEKRACECYVVVRNEYDRLLSCKLIRP